MSRPVRSAADVAAASRLWIAVPVAAALALVVVVLSLQPDTSHAPEARQQPVPEGAASEPAASAFVGA